MRIRKDVCKECGAEVQFFNINNHMKNHELEKKAAEKAAAAKAERQNN